MKKILFVMALFGLIQGCTTTSGGSDSSGSGPSTSRSFEMVAQDDRIATTANNMLASNSEITKKANISVESYNRVVLLTGQAPTAELRQQAVDLVKKVPDITRIFNQITIGTPTSPLVRSKDAATTANVKARMFATTNLKANNFKIITEDGTVYILGTATREQGDIAGKVARDSTGVQRVVKLIEYVSEDKKATT